MIGAEAPEGLPVNRTKNLDSMIFPYLGRLEGICGFR